MLFFYSFYLELAQKYAVQAIIWSLSIIFDYFRLFFYRSILSSLKNIDHRCGYSLAFFRVFYTTK